MNNRQKSPHLATIVLYAVAGLILSGVPIWYLLFSQKSPLQSHEAAFITGFGYGIGCLFYFATGVVMIFGVVELIGRRQSTFRHSSK